MVRNVELQSRLIVILFMKIYLYFMGFAKRETCSDGQTSVWYVVIITLWVPERLKCKLYVHAITQLLTKQYEANIVILHSFLGSGLLFKRPDFPKLQKAKERVFTYISTALYSVQYFRLQSTIQFSNLKWFCGYISDLLYTTERTKYLMMNSSFY